MSNKLLVLSFRVPRQQSTAEFVMLPLVRLNNIPVKRSRFPITSSFAEIDETLVSY